MISSAIIIMAAVSNRDFAFIVNVDSFPSPYLVEISRRKKIKKKNVNFFKPNAIFTPPTMNFIFKSIVDNRRLFKNHHQVIKEAMLEAIQCPNQEALASAGSLQTIGIECIVKQEISKVLNATGSATSRAPITCHKEHLLNDTLSKWRIVRCKRLIDEQHLHCSFISDMKRSKSELKYVIDKFKIN
jgi:hypothetical protein